MTGLMYQMYLMNLFQGFRYIKKVFLLGGPILAKKRFIHVHRAGFGRFLANIYQLFLIYYSFECIKCIWMNLRAYLGEKSSLALSLSTVDEPLQSAIYIKVHLVH